jgi:hypothetical protein
VIAGSGDVRKMVPWIAGEKSNVIDVQSALAFAAWMASRSVHCGPQVPSSVSAGELTCSVPPVHVCAHSGPALAARASITIVPIEKYGRRRMNPPGSLSESQGRMRVGRCYQSAAGR